MIEIDDTMENARIDGDEDLYTLCEMANLVVVRPDELGDEWVITFHLDDDEERNAYIPLDTDTDELQEWFRDAGYTGKLRVYGN